MAEILINRSRPVVWKYFTRPENWQRWWGSVLKEVRPNWVTGAILVWEGGGTGQISTFSHEYEVGFGSPFMERIWYFIEEENNSTLIKYEGHPRGGAYFTDGGTAERSNMMSVLTKLKQCIESEME